MRYPIESYQRLEKWYMQLPCLAFITSEKSMGVKHTVLPDGQPSAVAFTVLAQLCGPKASETEMGAAFFTKSGEGRNFCFDFAYSHDSIYTVLLLACSPVDTVISFKHFCIFIVAKGSSSNMCLLAVFAAPDSSGTAFSLKCTVANQLICLREHIDSLYLKKMFRKEFSTPKHRSTARPGAENSGTSVNRNGKGMNGKMRQVQSPANGSARKEGNSCFVS